MSFATLITKLRGDGSPTDSGAHAHAGGCCGGHGHGEGPTAATAGDRAPAGGCCGGGQGPGHAGPAARTPHQASDPGGGPGLRERDRGGRA